MEWMRAHQVLDGVGGPMSWYTYIPKKNHGSR